MTIQEEEEAFTAEIERKPIFENGAYIWEKSYPENISWKAEIEQKPIPEILDRAVREFGNNPAIDFMGSVWTYKELGELVDRAAKGLQALGVKKGVHVGLFLPNSPYSVIFYYATLKAGGSVVNYNPLYAERELVHQIEDSETDIMVTMDLSMLYDKVDKLLHETRLNKIIVCPMSSALPFPKNLLFPIVKRKDVAKFTADDRHIKYADIVDNDGKFEAVELNIDDIAVLQYTGGTTGVSKGAMLTHACLYSNVNQAAVWVHNAEPGKDVQLGIIPLFHVFAMTVVMHLSIWKGMKMVLLPKFDPEEFLDTFAKHKPTYFPAVPAVFSALANHPKIEDYDFSCLKFCLTGGAPMPDDVRRLFNEKTRTDVLGEGYGLTETSPVATCNPVGGAEVRPGSVGLPLPGTVIEIVSREDGETVLPTGEKGEVCISGPQVMKGYYNRPEATEKTIKNGRLHTGDVGYIDEDGYLFLVDRIKDLIIVRGYNVYPRHVEEAIYLHPAVEECIVAGVPDAERGETVWAWIKPAEGKELTEEDMKIFLEDKLSPIELPRRFVIRNEALPKTAVGKLSRKDLLEQEGIKRG